MASFDPTHFVVFLDSGGAGAILNNDASGNPTYASWSQNLALPVTVQDSNEYEVALSQCVYQTPSVATDGVIVYLDILMASSVGSEAYNLVIRIPPAIPLYLAGVGVSTPLPVATSTWPTVFIQQSTVIPWMPLGSGQIQRINATFASTTGQVISTGGNTYPFNMTLVIRRKHVF